VKRIAAFEAHPLNVFARSQVGERFFDYGPAVQQAAKTEKKKKPAQASADGPPD